MKRLVILRPEPGASRSAERARAMGLEVRGVPLFAITALDWTAPDPAQFDSILVTSANAFRFGGAQLDGLRHLPVHAVGASTAVAAREAGFNVASVGDGGVRRMSVPATENLLHLAGRDHVDAAATMTIAVYEAQAIARPIGLDDLRDQVVAVHSARAGARLAELVDDRSGIIIVAISPAVAADCGNGWQSVHAAPQPTDEALLALAASLCERFGA